MGKGAEGSGRLAVAAELLVVASDEFRVAARDRVAVEGHERVLAGSTGEFLADLVADLDQGLQHLEFDVGPVGLRLAALGLDADPAGLVAGVGDLGAKVLGIDELFDIAEPIGPLGEIIAGDRAGIASGVVLGPGDWELSSNRTAPKPEGRLDGVSPHR